MAEHVTAGMNDRRRAPWVRQCPLCVWINPTADGIRAIEHPNQPFCDRCMDDLAALIASRREGGLEPMIEAEASVD